ncbi:MAG: hypothetical protein KKH02_14210 [Proteobacteria bacterium]|nr:hypothetical protein [Pseudomonadota bacterium]
MLSVKTNFDQYLEEQLKDVVFAERFKKAGEAWASPKMIPITEGRNELVSLKDKFVSFLY